MRLLFTIVFVLLSAGCMVSSYDGQPVPTCSEDWFQQVEQKIPTGDGRGHRPDVGSPEWRSVIEFKLDIRDDVKLPSSHSDAWCVYIDQLLDQRQGVLISG